MSIAVKQELGMFIGYCCESSFHSCWVTLNYDFKTQNRKRKKINLKNFVCQDRNRFSDKHSADAVREPPPLAETTNIRIILREQKGIILTRTIMKITALNSIYVDVFLCHTQCGCFLCHTQCGCFLCHTHCGILFNKNMDWKLNLLLFALNKTFIRHS